MGKKLICFLVFTLYSNFSAEAQTLIPISEGINPDGSDPVFVTKLRDHFYLFRANSSASGGEPYVTDGTQPGTSLLKDINVGNGSSMEDWFYRLSDTLCVFEANDGDTNHGLELWRSNGTEMGTYMVTDLTPGPVSSNIWFSKPRLNESIFFRTYSTNTTGSLYITDGSISGTTVLLSGFDTFNDSQSGNVVGVVNGIAYFCIYDPYYSFHLWRTDGTVGGTFELMNLNIFGNNLRFETPLGANLLFAADDSIHGMELWKTDGTLQGTTLLKDLNPGVADANPIFLMALGDKLLFNIQNNSGHPLWATNGTDSGTYQLGDSSVFPVGSVAYQLGLADSIAYFEVVNDFNGIPTLWKTDGTISGTQHVHTFSCAYCNLDNPNASSVTLLHPDSLVGINGLSFFIVSYDTYIGYLFSIWATDGTDSGTYEVYANPYVEYSAPVSQFVEVCRQAFCVMTMGNDGDTTELWRFDAGGAYNLNLFPNYAQQPSICFEDDDAIFFTANNSLGKELYKLQVCDPTITQEISTTYSLSLFPNPNEGNFSLQLPTEINVGQLSVVDMTGRCLYFQDLNKDGAAILSMHLKNIPSGMYLLRINSNENNWQQLFVKQ